MQYWLWTILSNFEQYRTIWQTIFMDNMDSILWSNTVNNFGGLYCEQYHDWTILTNNVYNTSDWTICQNVLCANIIGHDIQWSILIHNSERYENNFAVDLNKLAGGTPSFCGAMYLSIVHVAQYQVQQLKLYIYANICQYCPISWLYRDTKMHWSQWFADVTHAGPCNYMLAHLITCPLHACNSV